MKPNYLIINKSDPNFQSIISACEQRHKEFYPDNNLSIADLEDGTVMVKVAGGDSKWQTDLNIEPSKVFDDKDSLRSSYYYGKVSKQVEVSVLDV